MAATPVITADALARRMTDLEPIGLSSRGTTRLPWTPEDRDARAWFRAQTATAGLSFHRDAAGNLWGRPDAAPPWVGVGSHLDSVPCGGRFDGALGVVCAFEIAARASVPVAVLSCADEEGARFNTPTFGSRALAGRLDPGAVLERRDDTGVTLEKALQADGIDPDRLLEAGVELTRLKAFYEIHVDQSLELLERGVPVAIVVGLAARSRWRVELHGRAGHAGATPPNQRRDALGTAARLVVAAIDSGREDSGLRVTAVRMQISPNALTTIADHVTVWLDARGPASSLERWAAALARLAEDLAAATHVEIAVRQESRSGGTSFDAQLRRRLGQALADQGLQAPETQCYAGHDAGILTDRLPAAMVLVRNPTGVSHAPEEDVDLDDAAEAANAVLDAVERRQAR